MLRTVFRRAVVMQYDQAKAEDRLTAAKSGNYTIKESVENRILGSGESAKMNIEFGISLKLYTNILLSYVSSRIYVRNFWIIFCSVCIVVSLCPTCTPILLYAAKGHGFRGAHSDTVDLLDETKIKAVVGLLIGTYGLEEDDETTNELPTTAREMLKPINM